MRWGKTEEDRQVEAERRRAAIQEWRPWFAWRPVRLEDGTWVWLETVLTRAQMTPGGIGWEDSGWVWERIFRRRP